MTFPRTPVAARAVLAEFLRQKGDEIGFLDYDWSLNGR
jgi:hypothetical protein